MRIEHFSLYRYKLLLVRPLKLKGHDLTHREGILVKLVDENNNTSWGEVSPLPGFSDESLETAIEQLRAVCSVITSNHFPDETEALIGGFASWLGRSAPSVRFGIETALLQLLAIRQGVPLRKLIFPDAADSIAINGLLFGSEDEIIEQTHQLLSGGYRTFKIKVGHRSFEEEGTITRWLRETVGADATIRLDANRAWSLPDAFRFAETVADLNVEYIEEPVRDYLEILQLINKADYPLPIALDESLSALRPEGLPSVSGIKAIVLKPTLLGLDNALRFAKTANRQGKLAVVSSSFETSLGLGYLAEIAAGVNKGISSDLVAAGLDTLNWFAEDIVDNPLHINMGSIDLSSDSTAAPGIRHDLLTEIPNE